MNPRTGCPRQIVKGTTLQLNKMHTSIQQHICLSYLQTHGDAAAVRNCVGVPELGGPLLRLTGPNQRTQNAMPSGASCALLEAYLQW